MAISTVGSREFYVYAWLMPCGTPFYIGKGKGARDKEFKKKNRIFAGIVQRLQANGTPPSVVRLSDGLSEQEAFDLERAEIAKHGRRDNGTGILANLTDGGEGLSGWIADGSWRAKVSAANMGKTHSDEARRKISEHRTGTKASPEVRKKMSETHLERYKDPGEREKLSHIHLERMSKECARAKHREAMARPETRAKISAAATLRARSSDWLESMRGLNQTPQARAKNAEAQLAKPPRSETGFKGVAKSGAKWRAKIVIDGKAKCLGTFKLIEDAARAYDKIAKELSASACLNFPSEATNGN